MNAKRAKTIRRALRQSHVDPTEREYRLVPTRRLIWTTPKLDEHGEVVGQDHHEMQLHTAVLHESCGRATYKAIKQEFS